MKKIIIVFLLMSASFAYAQVTQLYDWNTPQDVIRNSYPEGYYSDDGKAYHVESFMGGQDARLAFFFTDGLLTGQLVAVSLWQYDELLTVCRYLYGIPITLKQSLVWRTPGSMVVLGRSAEFAMLVFAQEK